MKSKALQVLCNVTYCDENASNAIYCSVIYCDVKFGIAILCCNITYCDEKSSNVIYCSVIYSDYQSRHCNMLQCNLLQCGVVLQYTAVLFHCKVKMLGVCN